MSKVPLAKIFREYSNSMTPSELYDNVIKEAGRQRELGFQQAVVEIRNDHRCCVVERRLEKEEFCVERTYNGRGRTLIITW